MPSAPNAPQQKPADPILYAFENGDELSKGLADFVIKVSHKGNETQCKENQTREHSLPSPFLVLTYPFLPSMILCVQ